MPTADAPVWFSEPWLPSTDVYVRKGCLVIQVELAGIRRECVQLLAEGNRLAITGVRPDDEHNTQRTFLEMEISYGPFQRVVEIPTGYDLAQAHASCSNGVLRVAVPARKR